MQVFQDCVFRVAGLGMAGSGFGVVGTERSLCQLWVWIGGNCWRKEKGVEMYRSIPGQMIRMGEKRVWNCWELLE